jgi:hypothetical protein
MGAPVHTVPAHPAEIVGHLFLLYVQRQLKATGQALHPLPAFYVLSLRMDVRVVPQGGHLQALLAPFLHGIGSARAAAGMKQ